MESGRAANILSSLDAVIFEGLTTPSLQILAPAGPLSRSRDGGDEVVVPTREFVLWPALLTLTATRVDVAEHRAQLRVGVIEAVRAYRGECLEGEQGGPRLGQPMDLIRLRLRALDRCLLDFVKRAVPMFHDEDPDWLLRQALRIARDSERALIERGLVVTTTSPGRGLPLVAALGLVPQQFLIRTPTGDGLLTAFREACRMPPGRGRGDLEVNSTLLSWTLELAFLLVDLLGHGWAGGGGGMVTEGW